MDIFYKVGDFLSGTEPFVLHGCNAQGVMGSGAALAVRNKYPGAYAAYREAYDDQELVLGGIFPYHTDDGKTVFNAITQQNFGKDKTVVYFDYDAFIKIVKKLNYFMTRYGNYDSRVAMPKIGCGLANGNWDIISCIIDKYAVNFVPVVYIL